MGESRPGLAPPAGFAASPELSLPKMRDYAQKRGCRPLTLRFLSVRLSVCPSVCGGGVRQSQCLAGGGSTKLKQV